MNAKEFLEKLEIMVQITDPEEQIVFQEAIGVIEQLQAELDKIREHEKGYAKLLGSANNDIARQEEYINQLQAENEKANMIIKAIEEWAVADMNNDLLAFIRETKAKTAKEIEEALQGKKGGE